MQRILIGENTVLQSSDYIINLLADKLGRDKEFWYKFMTYHEKLFRTNPSIQKVISENNCIVGHMNGEYEMLKIVEVPDGVKWHIKEHECELREYVAENYKTWE